MAGLLVICLNEGRRKICIEIYPQWGQFSFVYIERPMRKTETTRERTTTQESEKNYDSFSLNF